MKDWEFSVGFYPGILFGFRTYAEVNKKNHVFYFNVRQKSINGI